MEEDVLGTMRTVGQSKTTAYVACSRCGTMVLRQDARLVQGDALDDVSEFEQLCPTCYLALVGGEPDLPASEP